MIHALILLFQDHSTDYNRPMTSTEIFGCTIVSLIIIIYFVKNQKDKKRVLHESLHSYSNEELIQRMNFDSFVKLVNNQLFTIAEINHLFKVIKDREVKLEPLSLALLQLKLVNDKLPHGYQLLSEKRKNWEVKKENFSESKNSTHLKKYIRTFGVDLSSLQTIDDTPKMNMSNDQLRKIIEEILFNQIEKIE